MDIRQIYVTARSENGIRQYFSLHAVLTLLSHRQSNETVINQNRVSHFHCIRKSGVIHINRVLLLWFGATDGEFQNIAWS